MTNNELIQLASARLYTHFVKLYFPEELKKKNPENPTVELQKKAHARLCFFSTFRRAYSGQIQKFPLCM